MRKITCMLSAITFFLCANILAVSVGETVSYTRNSSRTDWLIRGASGALTVLERRDGGYIVKMTYELDVLLRDKQSGDIGMFIPDAIFSENFYKDLSVVNEIPFGAFTIKHMGAENIGEYGQCNVARAFKVDHNFKPDEMDKTKAQVLWIHHKGKIQAVSNLEITLKVNPGIPVLGAVQADVSGVSNNGIGFKAGLDAVLP
jgi:hypothetical protein